MSLLTGRPLSKIECEKSHSYVLFIYNIRANAPCEAPFSQSNLSLVSLFVCFNSSTTTFDSFIDTAQSAVPCIIHNGTFPKPVLSLSVHPPQSAIAAATLSG